ncbi:hypothetical protein NLG97_g10033 [Lecanicillium saksenae]|uniref:Uncharacterized protein n=1 Tax=Lecanicillium saksenae TaxID=468837 RepID=A0ACC1QEL3_9HYPO|nr:hypothetical protein NLG97_g10033 [Lecanicillium saksenae]
MSDHDSAIDIDSWRHSVPSRLEREDPFANDGFGERPVTRLVILPNSYSDKFYTSIPLPNESCDQTFREQDSPEEIERPASRFSLFRSKLFTPKREQQGQHGYESDDETTIYQRPSTAFSTRTKTKKKHKKRGFFASLFHRGKKRSREEYEDEHSEEQDNEDTLVSMGRCSTVVAPVISKPLHLNFLFVGCPSVGQTSLLYRIRYGYFPDTSVMPRTRYETYTHQPRCSTARIEL